MQIEHKFLKLFNALPESIKGIELGPFKSFIKINFCEQLIYTIQEYFEVVHRFL